MKSHQRCDYQRPERQVTHTTPLTHAAFFLFTELKPQYNQGHVAKKAEFYLKSKQSPELLQAGGSEVCF